MKRLAGVLCVTFAVWLALPAAAATQGIGARAASDQDDAAAATGDEPAPSADEAAATGAPEQPQGDAVSRAEALAAKARRLYTEGNYADAVAAYREAYDLAPAGALLYNVAYIYDRKLDLPDVAIEYYRRTLESPDADPELMRRATERLGELRVGQDARRRTPELPPESTTTRRGDPKWTWGWVAVGTGSALFAGGLALGLVANARQQDFESSRDLGDKRDLRDEGRKMAIAGDVMMGVGLAGAAAGTVLLLLSDGSGDTDGSVTTDPVSGWQFGVSPTAGGALLSVGGSL